MHLKRLYRDVQMMHPEIIASDSLKQFDVPEWGLPNAPILCLQSMNDNRLGRAHYDALVLHAGVGNELTHHLIETLPHSGASDAISWGCEIVCKFHRGYENKA